MPQRYRHPCVIPIEVWDAMLGERPLYARARTPSFGTDLIQLCRRLQQGVARREAGAGFPDVCRGIERLVVTGGAVADLQYPTAHLPVVVRPDLAEAGAQAILREAHGLVVDIGQSAIKVRGAKSMVARRDFDAIPIVEQAWTGAARAAFRTYVGQAMAIDAALQLVAMALPCEVAADCTLGGCTYPWNPGDATLLDELMMAAGLGEVPLLVLNDAELAAVGLAAAEEDVTSLVVTVGFGVGAAIVLDARAGCD